jgi:hypothetical protein
VVRYAGLVGRGGLLGLLLVLGLYDPIQFILQEHAPLRFTNMPLTPEHISHHVLFGMVVWGSAAFVAYDLRRRIRT